MLNLSPIFKYPVEVHAVVCEFVGVETLAKLRGLSVDWKYLVEHPTNGAWPNLYLKLWGERITPESFPGYSTYQLFMHRFKLLGLETLCQRLAPLDISHIAAQIGIIRKNNSVAFLNTRLIQEKRDEILEHCPAILPFFNTNPVLLNLAHLGMSQMEANVWLETEQIYKQYNEIGYHLHKIDMALVAHFIQNPLQNSIDRLEAKWLLKEAILLAHHQNNPFFFHDTQYRRDFTWLTNHFVGDYIATEKCLTIWKELAPAFFEVNSRELLFVAAKRGYWTALIPLLFERDCSVKDQKRRTALHYLSKYTPSEKEVTFYGVLYSLMIAGCSPLQRDLKDDSPLMLAVRNHCFSTLAFFLDRFEGDDCGKAMEQIVEVFHEETKFFDEQNLKMLELVVQKGLYPACDSPLFRSLLLQSEWKLLSYCYKHSCEEQLENIFDNLFSLIAYDSSQSSDILSKCENFSIILPRMEKFIARMIERFGTECLHRDEKVLLHACISFFESEIEETKSMAFNATDDFDVAFEHLLQLLEESYLTCVKLLATPKNISLLNGDRKAPLDLVSDRDSGVYNYLFDRLNPKKRAKVKV